MSPEATPSPKLLNPFAAVLVLAMCTSTSFLSNFQGKAFLHAMDKSESWFGLQKVTGITGRFVGAFLLTTLQMVLCAIVLKPDREGVSHNEVKITKNSHLVATLMTNISMAMMMVSTTFAIKVLEYPISAVMVFLVSGVTLSLATKVSLPVLLTGVVLLTGNPFTDQHDTIGAMAALASNLIVGCSHVAISHRSMTLDLNKRMALLVGCPLTVVTLVGLHVLETEVSYVPAGSASMATMAFLAAGSHVIHTFLATNQQRSGQTSGRCHSRADGVKSLMVVGLLWVVGRREITLLNGIGFLLCVLGLLGHSLGKPKQPRGIAAELDLNQNTGQKTQESRNSMSLFIKGVVIVSMCFCCVLFVSTSIIPKAEHKGMTSTSGKGGQAQMLQIDQPAVNLHEDAAKFGGFFPVNPFTFGRSQKSGGEFVNRFKLTRERELLPDASAIPEDMKERVQSFLSRRQVKRSQASGFLSKRLSTSDAVVRETQRLHLNIIGDILKGFKYAMLLDIADYENKGDSTITMGEIYFLARIGLDVVYYCESHSCTPVNLRKAALKAKEYKKTELVILIHGGGNLVLWGVHDDLRFQVFDVFKGFKIVQLPQSLSYTKDQEKHARECAEVYCCQPNLTIILRDGLSYRTASKLFKGSTKLAMAPDMAFQIGHVPRFVSPVFDILWIKRGDKEKAGYKTPSDFKGYKVHISDWREWRTPGGSNHLESAFYKGVNGFQYLTRGRVVITDRLHGHIMSTLMDIPHVIVDNAFLKVTRYHNTWTKSLENTVVAETPEEALDLAIGLLEKYNHTLALRVPFTSVSEDHKPNTFGEPNARAYP